MKGGVSPAGLGAGCRQYRPDSGETPLTKSGKEIMEILEAYDLTRCAHSAGQLAGVDEKTVTRYVAMWDAGGDPTARVRRPRSIDPFLPKIEELVDKSQGRIRADVVHARLVAMGFGGTDRTTRRAVAEAKTAWRGRQPGRHPPGDPRPGPGVPGGRGGRARGGGPGAAVVFAGAGPVRVRGGGPGLGPE